MELVESARFPGSTVRYRYVLVAKLPIRAAAKHVIETWLAKDALTNAPLYIEFGTDFEAFKSDADLDVEHQTPMLGGFGNELFLIRPFDQPSSAPLTDQLRSLNDSFVVSAETQKTVAALHDILPAPSFEVAATHTPVANHEHTTARTNKPFGKQVLMWFTVALVGALASYGCGTVAGRIAHSHQIAGRVAAFVCVAFAIGVANAAGDSMGWSKNVRGLLAVVSLIAVLVGICTHP